MTQLRNQVVLCAEGAPGSGKTLLLTALYRLLTREGLIDLHLDQERHMLTVVMTPPVKGAHDILQELQRKI